ncbi:helix-turn-helix transcriptional regulator [Microbacterium sp. T2.11-28]|uniref:helix-turn-helix transcriptional regulator n=1 Tax=Microbacterium sp. T2.11-28 TaxID=3041169 RepID=UPI002477433C|nr:helix-turn-helix transcriptional regulator [Microbacterium sp. T2.11-28]CAI9386062.1 hypothetical protein MICABA_00152 [Microbacterium sp. T2.11-28]
MPTNDDPDFIAELDATIGANLKLFREKRGISQGDLAKRVTALGVPGVHQTTIARVEGGQRALRAAEILAVCRVLDTSLEALAESRANVRLRANLNWLRENVEAFRIAAESLMHARLIVAQELDNTYPYGPDGVADDDLVLRSGANPQLYEGLESRLVSTDPANVLGEVAMGHLSHRTASYRRRNDAEHKGRTEFLRDGIEAWMGDDGEHQAEA